MGALGGTRTPNLLIRSLVRAVRPGSVEALTEVERPEWSVATQRRSASWVHDGYTDRRRGRGLAGRVVDDDVVVNRDVDALRIELRRRDQALPVAFYNAEVAARSSRECPCIVHVQPHELATNGRGALKQG
jgi:hypothetical protein